MRPILRGLRIAVADVPLASTFLASVCGSTVVDAGLAESIVPVGDAELVVEPMAAGGVKGVGTVVVDNPSIVGTISLNGLVIDAGSHPSAHDFEGTDVVLDHVAVLVADLESAAEQWEAATGAEAELIGLHPISGGTLRAARLALGDRMIELVSPVSGKPSPLSSRLDEHGEGAFAVAMPALDLEDRLRHLRDQEVRTVRQDPHWLVHPANPAGVLIQLTPRVQH